MVSAVGDEVGDGVNYLRCSHASSLFRSTSSRHDMSGTCEPCTSLHTCLLFSCGLSCLLAFLRCSVRPFIGYRLSEISLDGRCYTNRS
jgi:hypothetical protein